jgi:hypothetical protein
MSGLDVINLIYKENFYDHLSTTNDINENVVESQEERALSFGEELGQAINGSKSTYKVK